MGPTIHQEVVQPATGRVCKVKVALAIGFTASCKLPPTRRYIPTYTFALLQTSGNRQRLPIAIGHQGIEIFLLKVYSGFWHSVIC